MTDHKQKLELTWIGKDNRPRLEPRILLEDPELSYHASHRVSDEDIFDNRLIFGDNLLALRALEQEFTGKIKCIYIDPPYNTGQAFEHYDDGLEHSLWLNLMRDRLEILHKLLSFNGALFVQLNDEELAYCKILLDEVFGRANFINQIAVKTKNTAGASGGGEDKRLKKNVEYILIYVKNQDPSIGFSKFNDVYEETDLFDLIDDMESEGKSWKYTSILLEKGKLVDERIVFDGAGDEIRVRKYKGVKRTTVNQLLAEGQQIESVYGTHFHRIFSDTNAQTSIRTRIIDEFKLLEKDELLEAEYIPRSGRDRGTLVQHLYISPTIRRVIWLKDTAEKKGERILKKDKLGTYWSGFNWNNVSKEGNVIFPNGKKPEALIKQVLELATEKGDWVLDSFAGSGTTGAVAHKMGRRWIMVELGDHCHTHIIPRIKRVIEGEDTGGITPAAHWKGGGGFRYFRLASSLLEKDRWGNWVINKEYNAAMLAEAVCKLEGFTYAPSEEQYWMHGYSSEQDFIYVTTQTLTQEQLLALSEEVGPQRTLLVLCSAYRAANGEAYPNLTIKKIPQAVLSRCEYGHDDYSLQVANLPSAPLAASQKDDENQINAQDGPRQLGLNFGGGK
jgi:adenine-specific DNA-methyltransferase